MRTPRRPAYRLAALAVTAASAGMLLPLAVVAPAAAASWTTLADVDGARPQACKVPAEEGRAVKVRVRLVNQSPQTADATFTVRRGGSLVDRTRFSTEAGQTTAVRVLRVPDPRTHVFGYGLSTPDGGLGDTDALSYIGRC
ncbi:hypothetical protein [Nocardioides sp. AX2bis]|uniref:hypothetical protein n=1 Tax=Nocardioides sp. AX2bis TaxID=2653157 RepID=UPI0012F25431|nr:hypothetical protein [Nocardioides sp. AX2bis]VXB29812.1 exported hypothetical protein [Nocardioides sp. AX2bis]